MRKRRCEEFMTMRKLFHRKTRYRFGQLRILFETVNEETAGIVFTRRQTFGCTTSSSVLSNKICIRYTVRPLLSAELDYPRFLKPKFITPNLYEVQSDLC